MSAGYAGISILAGMGRGANVSHRKPMRRQGIMIAVSGKKGTDIALSKNMKTPAVRKKPPVGTIIAWSQGPLRRRRASYLPPEQKATPISIAACQCVCSLAFEIT